MLRSSREGRKQAARYHASPSSPVSTSDLFQAQNLPSSIKVAPRSMSSLYADSTRALPTDNGARQASGTYVVTQSLPEDRDDDGEQQQQIIDPALEGLSAYTLQVQHPSPTKERVDSAPGETRSASKGRAFSLPHLQAKDMSASSFAMGHALLEPPSVTLPPTPSTSEATTSATGNVAALQWSRETSFESQSNVDSTSLSSPPSSHAQFESEPREEAVQERLWEEGSDLSSLTQVDISDAFSSSSSSSSQGESSSTPRRRTYKRFAPRQVQGESLITHRAPRIVNKSLRQVEAEETMALTPARKRSSTSREPLSSEPSTPSCKMSFSTPKSDNTLTLLKASSASSKQSARGNTKRHGRSPIARYSQSALSAASSSQQEVEGSFDSPAIKKRGRPKGTTKQVMLQRALAKGLSPLSPSSVQDPSNATRSTFQVYQSYSSASKLLSSDLLRSLSMSASTSGPDDLRTTDLAGSLKARDMRRDKKSTKSSWKRKTFWSSGLYSNDHKVDEAVKLPVRKSALPSRLLQGTSRTRPSNHDCAFPLPIDHGYWLLTERRDFRLPFNIVQENEEIRLKMASKRKPPSYKHISQNRYVSRPKLPGEIMVCQCPPTGTCDDSCMNRQTQYLCHPKHCPCGDRCTNVQFGKRKPIKTEVHYYGARGFGLRAMEPVPKGSFIDEYRGEVISYNEMVRRVRDHYKDTGNYYFLMYDAPAGEMLDGGLKGNITRFANHSCDPNCKIQKWLVCGTDEQRAGEFQVALFAGRDIAAGEELTYDYGWSAFSPKSVTGEASEGGEICHCGAANCSGVMGVRKSMTTIKPTTSKIDRMGKRGRKKKQRGRLPKADAQTGTDVLMKATEQLSGRKPDQPLLPFPSFDRSATKKTIKIPSTLLQLIPSRYRTSDEIEVPEQILAKVKEDLGANLSTPQGRQRWEGAIAVLIEAHVYNLKSSRHTGADDLGSRAQEAPPSGEKRKAVDAEVTPTTSESKRVKRGPTQSRVTSSLGKRRGRPLGSRNKPEAATTSTKAPAHKNTPLTERRQRVYVKDRIAFGLPSAPSQLIDSDHVVILEGKRQRKASDRYSEVDNKDVERKRGQRTIKRHRTTPSAVDELAQIGDGSWMTIDSSFTLPHSPAQRKKSAAKEPAWNADNYPPGTQFYARNGEPFDFADLSRKQRGKKPRPYTIEELEAANERHRQNLKRLNDMRKFKRIN